MLRRSPLHVLPTLPNLAVCSAAVALLVAACDDGESREPLTLIVDADRARGDEDRARLLEMRTGVQQDRAALDKTRHDLSELRARLEKTLSSDDVVRLQATERALQERAACNAEAAVDPVMLEAIIRRVVVEELDRRDERWRNAGAAVQPPSTPGATTTSGTAPSVSLVPSVLSHGSSGRPVVAPTRDDVRRKYSLVRDRASTRDVVGTTRTRIDALSDEAMTKLMTGDLIGASILLDEALALLGN